MIVLCLDGNIIFWKKWYLMLYGSKFDKLKDDVILSEWYWIRKLIFVLCDPKFDIWMNGIVCGIWYLDRKLHWTWNLIFGLCRLNLINWIDEDGLIKFCILLSKHTLFFNRVFNEFVVLSSFCDCLSEFDFFSQLFNSVFSIVDYLCLNSTVIVGWMHCLPSFFFGWNACYDDH
jgi:hypothetical protein